MSKLTITKPAVRVVKIRRTEIQLDVPPLTKGQADKIRKESGGFTDETDRWIFNSIASRSSLCSDSPRTVCFRKPIEYDMKGKVYCRFCDFNSALGGTGLSFVETVRLFVCIQEMQRVGDNSFIGLLEGGGFEIFGSFEQAGKYLVSLRICLTTNGFRLSFDYYHESNRPCCDDSHLNIFHAVYNRT